MAPSTPIGPRDIKPTPTGRIIVEAATGRMPAFVDTGLNLVHVDDVAQGHLLALDKGKIGENYILGGEDVALQTMLGDIAFLSGRKAPTIKLPRAPLFPLACAAEAVARVTGKEPFLTADALRMSRYRMFFSSRKGQARAGLYRAPLSGRLERRAGLVPRQRVSEMIAGILFGFVPLAIWLYLLLFHGGFWLLRERDTMPVAEPAAWPSVVAVVPARDEADVIQRSIGSLIAQDYPGEFRIVLVDDQSSDGTGDLARALNRDRLTVLTGAARPPGWTGKLWAMKQGAIMRRRSKPEFLWFTDADIAHGPDNLRQLVARAEDGDKVLVSLMARLSCKTAAEHFLIPAFVFFFDMLFPFGAVNDPHNHGRGGGRRLHAGAPRGAGKRRRHRSHPPQHHRRLRPGPGDEARRARSGWA